MMILIAGGCLFLLIFLAVFLRYAGLWIQCKMTKAGISFPRLVIMTIRKVNPAIIVRSKIMAVQAGLTDISTQAMEAHYLAGGDITKVIRALVAAHRANLDLDW
ncbi:MAG: flotillin-like FloA family protein, partial [Planctomycetaceae bacterium]|nr:flotillin-like FloA family protein [Planctomycetaceae bacterium]